MRSQVASSFFLMAMLCGCCASIENQVAFQTGLGGFGEVRAPISSFEERRFATVIRQQYDFSCGSAALATLLNHYNRARSEATVFNGMWRAGNRAQISKLGFSLGDMKRYLLAIGLKSDGYNLTLEKIEAGGVPGIALVEINGYRHFVVVKGINDREMLIGDPALGLRTMPRRDFEKAWNGIYFIINQDTRAGRESFNVDRQWAAFSRAPVGAEFVQPLSQQALTLTAPFIRDF